MTAIVYGAAVLFAPELAPGLDPSGVMPMGDMGTGGMGTSGMDGMGEGLSQPRRRCQCSPPNTAADPKMTPKPPPNQKAQ